MKRKIEITPQKNRIPCNISNSYQDESLNDTREIKSSQAKPQTNNKSKFSNPKNDLNQSQHKIVHINCNTFNAATHSKIEIILPRGRYSILINIKKTIIKSENEIFMYHI